VCTGLVFTLELRFTICLITAVITLQ